MQFDVEEIRKDFPILNRKVNGKDLVYLDNAATSQKPKEVIDSIRDYYMNHNANVHRGVHLLSVEATDAYENARIQISDLINCPNSNSIIWTRNATESLNLVASSWALDNLTKESNIIITNAEHHSNLVTWQQVSEKTGCDLRYLNISDGFDLSDFENLIDEKTKLVAVTHMSNVLGYVVPIEEIVPLARKYDARVLVDGAQSVPHMPVDVLALDIDFLVFSAHKMLGPTGIGVLYAKLDLLEDMNPYMFGGDMILEVTYEDAKWNRLPYKFEAGTPNISGAISTGVAANYLMKIGMENVWEHENSITKYALEKFRELNNFNVIGDNVTQRRGGVISFTHNKIHPHDIGTILDKQGIAIRTGHHCAMPLIRSYGVVAAARASFYIYNTLQEVDQLVEALQDAEDFMV
ncbi:MAG: cysteine desulfurase [Parcubacteria group bacterium]|jgi:cysteine desulfurase/selenocysteine lyase|nr:cysteine desulfurase [Parcubacteria group bacterium]MBU88340.1 cysteine desulfurase [Chloroflexota bacterium]MDP7232441.1 cysteine desulfurase [Dehalococcoidia bacterium]MDP7613471.1 cysteine desulfurase [Dehalococcoidia bacterium]